MRLIVGSLSLLCETPAQVSRYVKGLTSIETTHEGDPVVDNAELLVVGPKEYDIVACAVQRLQRIVGEFRHAEGTQRQVGEGRLQLGADHLPTRMVVRVTEDLDVLVQRLEVVFRVLSEMFVSLNNLSPD